MKENVAIYTIFVALVKNILANLNVIVWLEVQNLIWRAGGMRKGSALDPPKDFFKSP